MDGLERDLQQVFSEVTRYPLDVLDLTADLEEDLGIDSVKRAEILAVCQTKFDLPERLDIPPERLNTIANIAIVIRSLKHDASAGGNGADAASESSHAGGSNGQASAPAPAAAAPPGRAAAGEPAPARDVDRPPVPARWSRGEVERLVVDTLAEVTRYPREILELQAELEDDLGIDSVKRAEVIAVLQQRLALPNVPPPAPVELIRVDDIVTAALDLLAAAAGNGNGDGNGDGRPIEALAAPGVALPAAPSAAAMPVWAWGCAAKPFAEKVALVTGSGHGIGRVIASQLADLGATVIINSFHSRERGEAAAEAIRAAGGNALHYWGSVANPAQLHKLFDDIEARFGHLDLFVSNASNGMIAPLAQISEAHWDRAFRTNVIALHAGALRAAELMRRRGGGKIVTLSSPGAQRYIKYFGCMGPIKAAVESLTRYLAIELAPDNIQVNSVSAGPIYGELLSKYPESDRLIGYWESLSAGKRLGDESDVANFVAFLLSSAADKITGSVLLVDSGGSQRIDL